MYHSPIGSIQLHEGTPDEPASVDEAESGAISLNTWMHIRSNN